MIPFEEFNEDQNNFVNYLKKVFKESEGELPFPARMCGATVSNFKSLQQVKCPSRKINNIFGKLGATQEKEEYK